MGKWKNYIPDGTRDILFDECSMKRKIENKLMMSYLRRGFKELISPTLEFYDVFNIGNEPIEQEKMYKLFDNKGRILVLRPDMTTPIARIASSKIKHHMYPLKLCYTSNIFRVNNNLSGKIGEITQSGIEIIGVEDIKADVEILVTVIKALKNIGLKHFKIEIGQVNFFKALVEEISMDDSEKEMIRSLVESKNYHALSNYIDENIDRIGEEKGMIFKKFPTLYGNFEVLEVARKISNNKKAQEALDNIQKLYEIIREIGLEEYISIDLGMLHKIDYYTGLIFRGYADRVGEEILSGGRYDNLLNNFSEDACATGLAINEYNLMTAIMKQEGIFKTDKVECVVFCDNGNIEEAYKLIDKANEEECIWEMSLFNTKKETMDYALKNKIKKMMYNNEIIEVE